MSARFTSFSIAITIFILLAIVRNADQFEADER